MKKKYMEPVMIVEDFTVSEMVAGNCRAPTDEIKLCSQMNTAIPACGNGLGMTDRELEIWNAMGQLYGDGGNDFDQDGHNDSLFTDAYHDVSSGSEICSMNPYDKGYTFGMNTGIECSDDSQLLLNSL